ncbi:hypothetical protein LTR95_005623 [Oleoguttula sp. CCFEE 5521]
MSAADNLSNLERPPSPSADYDASSCDTASPIASHYYRFYTHLHIQSWSYSLMPMTTLGLSTLLSAQRSLHDFPGLYALGLIVYFIGLLQWLFLFLAKAIRFATKQGAFAQTLSTPQEAMFFATFWIGAYGIITAGVDFAAPEPGGRLAKTFLVFFWIYMVCALTTGIGLHLLLFYEKALEAKDMTPAWLLPVLPIILIGVMAGSVADSLSEEQRFPVIICGLLCSGMGFLVSLPVAAIWFFRLFTNGFPDPDARPGTMIAVGPPTYAPLAWLKLAAAIPKHYGFFASVPIASDVAQVMAVVIGLGVFGLGLFFLLMAFAATVRRASSMHFHLTWYGFVFPNVGLLSALGILSNMIPSDGLNWFVSVCTALLSGVWLFVTAMHIRAIATKSEGVQ